MNNNNRKKLITQSFNGSEEESFNDVFFSNINDEDKVKLIDHSITSKMKDRPHASDLADITPNIG